VTTMSILNLQAMSDDAPVGLVAPKSSSWSIICCL